MKSAVNTFTMPYADQKIEKWLNELPGEVVSVSTETFVEHEYQMAGMSPAKSVRVVAFYKEQETLVEE